MNIAFVHSVLDLKGKIGDTGSGVNRSLHNHHHLLNGNPYGHTGGLMLNNIKSTNKDTTSSMTSISSPAAVDDCARTSSPQSLRAIYV